MNKPIIGITIGDPAGIGPEIVLKSLLIKDIYDVCLPVIIGNKKVLEDTIKLCNLNIKLNEIDLIKKAKNIFGVVDFFNVEIEDVNQVEYGKVQSSCGKAAYDIIKFVTDLAMKKEISAVATAPINKESLHAAKINYIGHTEIFAGLTNCNDPLTMFEVERLRVFFLSRHVSLKKACEMVTKERVSEYIKKSIEALKKLGVNKTLAVAGLNPHCGENGLFGYEEVNEIIPAIEEMQEKGYDVIGPIGADSIFAKGLDGRYGAILSLYHDQGHIATKTYDFHRTISITNGLPFLRTSVDHGTAFDIAGKNIANETSMIEAIKAAAKYAKIM